MLHIALLEPEIAQNTGNIARSCAATGTRLHLIGRLGFRLDDRYLKREGCDYWDLVDQVRHADWETFVQAIAPRRIIALSAHAEKVYTKCAFRDEDVLLFGNESSGLPPAIIERFRDQVYCIPMPAGGVRSLNLATAAGIVLYEAIRQITP